MKRMYMLHCVVAGALIGLYVARYISVASNTVLLIAFVTIIVAIRFPRLVLLCPILVGVWLGVQRALPLLEGYDRLDSLQGERVMLLATVQTDPVYHKSGQYELNANNLRLEGDPIDATIRIRSYTNDVRRGDRIRVSGKLRDGFASWQASMYYAELNVLQRDTSFLHSFRAAFIANIYSTLPDPEASLGLGFLMGVRTLLPEDLEMQLSITGLTHIVAVSGYNLTILANASKRMLQRYSRFQAAVFTIALILAFVTVTGMSPSILRAVIVSCLSLGAWYYGRAISPWVLLVYSSSISAFMQPAYAWFGIGWYLSLAAFFGVLVLAPLLKQKLMGDKEPKLFSQIVIESSMAQLVTMPIIMLIFGEVSVIALAANIAVLPFIPITMIATLLVGIFYFVNLSITTMFAEICYIILNYITSVIEFLSRIEWSLIGVQISVQQLLVLVGCIGVVFLALRRAARV